MFGRFHRLGLDEERPLKPVFTSVVAGQGQHRRQVLLLPFHIRIEQRHIPFAASPEHVIFASESDGRVDRVFDLHGRARNRREVGIGRRAVHVPTVTEHIGRPPQQLYAGLPLLLPGILHDSLQILLVFGYGAAFADEIDIVKAIVRSADFHEEIESRIHLDLRLLHRIGDTVPRETMGAASELIAAVGAERMPVSDRETKVFFHGLARHDPVLVVPAKRQRIFRIGPFVPDLAEF